jgi:Secretion system C-terminal sorting domain
MKKLYTPFLLFIMLDCAAQWSNTTNQFYDSLHMPVCTAVGEQKSPMSITGNPDGGTIVFWEDKRTGFLGNTQIFAQKFDKDGNRLWAVNGVPVSSGTNNQHFTYSLFTQEYRNRPMAAADGAGGFYIAYVDDSIANFFYHRICVQHVKSDGSAVFSGAGFVEAQTLPGGNYDYSAPQLIADDNGGFYVAYIKNDIGVDYVYIYCYKDINGTMKLQGGGPVNYNGVAKQDPGPCTGSFINSVLYPGTIVTDYNIWPDLQGNCSIIMSMTGNTGSQGKMLCYNKAWKAKKNSVVSVSTLFPDGNPDTQIINYNTGAVDILYKLSHYLSNRRCTDPSAGLIVWVDDLLTSNGFQVLDIGGYDYSYPKGATVATSGNINAELLAYTKRTFLNGVFSNYSVQTIGNAVEKYDSVPFQRASNNDPLAGFNGVVPPLLNKLNFSRDTLLAEGTGNYDFSLAGGGSQIFASALVNEPGFPNGVRSVRLQHLGVDRESADSFAIHFKTSNNKGEIIGKEINAGGGSNDISYDFPLVTVNNTGNALFYIREYARSARVSPIQNGAQLAWGAMGKSIGSGIFNNSFYNADLPYATLDPLDGSGVISWQDTRNVPAISGTNIFMRHLDSINVVDYTPPNKALQLLLSGTSSTNPAVLAGSSNKHSIMEAFINNNGTATPVISILDNYNLGAVSVNVFQNTGAIRTFNGKPYLNRNYTIKPENNPNGAATINLRLFFTTAEFDALITADPTIINPGLLSVIKQPNTTATAPAAYTPIAGEIEIVPAAWKAVDGGYYLEISVSGFSNFFIQKTTNSPLPVKWLGIQAQWQNPSHAKVSWQVAEQQNVKEYTVQHSKDGGTYTNVCKVPFSNITNYNCIVPANSNAKNYYRVMQQDVDGRTTYSDVAVLQSSTNPLLTLYPNPAKDNLYLDGLANFSALKIADANGKTVRRQYISAVLKYIDISQLNSGVYFLTVSGDKGTQTLKFIKN